MTRRRSLVVDGLVNARDLGGLPRTDGGVTPSGVLFRSETLERVTASGWAQLHAVGVRTVVDLRRPDERGRDTAPRPDWLHVVPVDLDDATNDDFWADYWDNGLVGTALYYLPHLAAMPERAGAALAAIASAPPGGVLFHCAGGRDRTGLVAMLLLRAAGVQDEAIVDDYLETVRRADLLAASSGRSSPEAMLEGLCRSRGTTTEGAFRTALAGIDLPALLDAAGVSSADRRALASWRGALPRN